MNIIEREIMKRRELIEQKSAKLAEAQDLRAKADSLAVESNAIDEGALYADIAELESYIEKETE